MVQIGTAHLTTQDGDLMPERQDLDLRGSVTAPKQNYEPEDMAEDEVEERPGHSSEDGRYLTMLSHEPAGPQH